MPKCGTCGSSVAENSRFCSSCGQPLNPGDMPTMAEDDLPTMGNTTFQAMAGDMPTIDEADESPRVATRPPSAKVPSSPRPASAPRTPSSRFISSHPSSSEGRFLPGVVVADRYRIIALLGAGGMGEVYRADDLSLGQGVALKFLPETASQDPDVLERFRNEVRIARRVSHPNVCRVYDMAELDGQIFISMEYIDGEDLSSLLRRIGRLPSDKALEIARQLCAGLAAAHREGVLHRDLKPSNIMLDGRGRAVMTDFGLAGLAEQIQGRDVRSGTPAYMAPEQLTGAEVSVRSDIYALGLVMYEVFTGKRPHDVSSLPDLVKQRQERTTSNPSSWVRDLDPAVERVIMRCLEPNPQMRPSSALAVAAALPGGDPLAAALAAGETPSPQMVAAAGEHAGFSPRVAFLGLLATLIGFAVFLYFAAEQNGLSMMRLEHPPDVLSAKAREAISKLGYNLPSVDRAHGFSYDQDYLEYVRTHDKPIPDWKKTLSERVPLLRYWYRQSPREMVADSFWGSLIPGVVQFDDPQPIQSGMINLRTDSDGRLIYFQAVPPELDESPQAPATPDWTPLFAAADLNLQQFQSAEPEWNSLADSDVRAAWIGKWPGTDRALRVEAAAWHGQPVFFSMVGPWTRPERMRPFEITPRQKASGIVVLTLAVLLLTAAILLAYRNLVKGKGDRKGALRLALFTFTVQMVLFFVRTHYVPTFDMFGIIVIAVSTALFFAALMGVLYLALEPYVRRHWPQTIISWTRLVDGRLKDPLVGRDICSGLLMGTAWIVVFGIGGHFLARAGDVPSLGSTDYLLGLRETVGIWLSTVVNSVLGTLIFFFVLVLLRVFLKNQYLAAALFVALFSTPQLLNANKLLIAAPVWIIIYLIAAVAVVRWGLVVLGTATLLANILLNTPISFDFSKWYTTNSTLTVLAFVALGAWAFYHSLAGQELWKGEMFE
jgi:serine/threonine protein kinase